MRSRCGPGREGSHQHERDERTRHPIHRDITRSATPQPAQGQRRLAGYVFANQAELEAAFDMLCTDEDAAIATYGAVATWVISGITSLKGLLSPEFSNGQTDWNTVRPHMATCNVAGIGDLDTSSVTDMEYVEGGTTTTTTSSTAAHRLLQHATTTTPRR